MGFAANGLAGAQWHTTVPRNNVRPTSVSSLGPVPTQTGACRVGFVADPAPKGGLYPKMFHATVAFAFVNWERLVFP